MDEGDQRLPVFTNDSARTQTIAVQEGPVTAIASSYGEPFAYRPEDRPFMAVDGDPTTAWLVADRAPAEGQRIRFRVAEPIDHVTLHQPQGAGAVRHLGAVTIAVDDRAPQHVTLDERSLSAGGQRVDLDPTSGPSTVTITIDGVVVPDPTLGPASAAVGFSEVDFGLGPTIEVVRPPVVVTSAMTSGGTATPVTYVLTRLRTRPTDRWRSDPEAAMVREITVPAEQAFTPTVTVRLDQRATDAVLAGLLGITGAQASARLTGAPSAAGWSATDGDPTTAWITPFGQAVGSTLDAQAAAADCPSSTVTQRAGRLLPRHRAAADQRRRRRSTSRCHAPDAGRRQPGRASRRRCRPGRSRCRSPPSTPGPPSTAATASPCSSRPPSPSSRSARRRPSRPSWTPAAVTTWSASTANPSRCGSRPRCQRCWPVTQ